MARGRPQNPRARGAGRGRGRGRGGAPMPFDSKAARESAELGNEGADTRAKIAGQYAQAQHQLGFGAGIEDPYAAAGLNREKLANQQRGIVNTAGNSLYAGSTVNARREAVSGYDQRQKEIDENIAQAQTDFAEGEAKTARDEALGNAAIKEGAISRAAATEPQPLAPGGGRRQGRGRARPGAPVNNQPRSRGRGKV